MVSPTITEAGQLVMPCLLEAVVIGGSAGAFAALRFLLPALKTTLHVPVAIVVHVPADKRSLFADIFRRACQVEVKEATDHEKLEAGTVYFAPSGHHLRFASDRSLALSSDEPVHYSRPSIDVLFESASNVFRKHLLAVLLSGANDDGAPGLKAIRAAGGTTIVQRPETAQQSAMPAAAIKSAVLSVDEMAMLFASLGTPAMHSASENVDA